MVPVMRQPTKLRWLLLLREADQSKEQKSEIRRALERAFGGTNGTINVLNLLDEAQTPEGVEVLREWLAAAIGADEEEKRDRSTQFCIAVTGPSGVGKSLMAKILIDYYEELCYSVNRVTDAEQSGSSDVVILDKCSLSEEERSWADLVINLEGAWNDGKPHE